MSGDRVQVLSADLAAILPRLLNRIDTGRKTAIGISGAPGSGKSTLARALVRCLNQTGIPACLLALDDYYLGRSQRVQLAVKLHPLFQQRGVPGTHELDRLLADFDQIWSGKIEGLRLPVFDKSIDDRVAEHEWRSLEKAPRIVIFEGWCIGVPPQQKTDLDLPVNEMECVHDAHGAWRHEMRKVWQRLYNALHGRLDQVWYIRVPGWNRVIDWRWQQEQELPRINLKSRAEVEKFLGCFERIVNHMQNSYPQWADLVMEADRNHCISLPEQRRKTT